MADTKKASTSLGVLVAIAGIAYLGIQLSQPAEPAAVAAETVATTAAPATTTVDPQVAQAIASLGPDEVIAVEGLPGVPPEVFRVLSTHNAVLNIPVEAQP